MQGTDFATYFSTVYIISLPNAAGRPDDPRAALSGIGFEDRQVISPRPADPKEANGFASPASHGRQLDHLAILRDISNRGTKRALIVESDAIFRSKLSDRAFQRRITGAAAERKWAIWFIGHRLRQGLRGVNRDVVPIVRPVTSAHCYGVQSGVVDDLIRHLSSQLNRPLPDPGASRPGIDRMIDQFRKNKPEYRCLISNPALSIRHGAGYGPVRADRSSIQAVMDAGYRARDGFWRRTGIDFRRVQ